MYPNSRSSPSTADILVTGKPRTLNTHMPYIKFGDTCMVPVSVAKRSQIAQSASVSVKDVSRVELGVCLGFSPSSPGASEFLLANGEIVSRNQFERVNVCPFDWKRKTVVQAELSPPSTGLSSPQMSVQAPSLDVTPIDSPSLSPLSVPWFPPAAPASGAGVPLAVVPSFASPVSVPVDVIASVPDSAAVFSPASSVPEVTTVASAVPEPVVVAPVDVMPSSSVLPALRRSSRVRSAYDCNAMPPLHSAVTLQACAEISSVRPRRHRDRRYRVRSRRSSKVSRVTSLPLRADALSISDLALLAPHLRETRTFWSATVPVQTSEELLYDEAMCLMAAAPNDPVMACVGVYPVPSSELIPIPCVQCKEVPLRTALRSDGAQRLRVATATEVDKNFSLGAWGKVCSVDEAMKDSDAIIFRAIVLYKLKADGRETCRIAAQGSSVPDPPASETFSSVASDNAKLLVLSAMEAHCSSRDEPLIISDCDVVGGFLHIDLDSPVPLYLCFPPESVSVFFMPFTV